MASATQSAAQAAVNLDLTLGGVLLGLIISCIFFGVLVSQTLRYFTLNSDSVDGKPLTTMVLTIFALDVAHSCFVGHTAYEIFVKNFGNLAIMDKIPFSGLAAGITQCVTAAIVQIFFSYRIRKFSGKWFISTINWILAACRISFTLAANITFNVYAKSLTVFSKKYSWTIAAVVIFGVVQDILITAGMTYYLRKRNQELMNRTRSVIYHIMRITLEGGALTSIVGIGFLVSVLVAPHSSIWIAFYFVWSKTYSTSLLSSLNSRHELRAKLHSTAGDNISTSFHMSAPTLENGTRKHLMSVDQPITVHVSHTGVTQRDHFD